MPLRRALTRSLRRQAQLRAELPRGLAHAQGRGPKGAALRGLGLVPSPAFRRRPEKRVTRPSKSVWLGLIQWQHLSSHHDKRLIHCFSRLRGSHVRVDMNRQHEPAPSTLPKWSGLRAVGLAPGVSSSARTRRTGHCTPSRLSQQKVSARLNLRREWHVSALRKRSTTSTYSTESRSGPAPTGGVLKGSTTYNTCSTRRTP